MKMTPRCTYCLMSRVHYQSELSTKDPEVIARVMKACLETLAENYSEDRVSTSVASEVHRTCYRVLNDSDPYRRVKAENNRTALEMLPFGRKLIFGEAADGEACTIDSSPYPLREIFRRAVLVSVIGNYFDFGIMGADATDDDFKRRFDLFFREGLFIDDTEKMFSMLDNVVYLIDNCGEIIFDREVFDIIRRAGGHVTLVVRGKAILTDVTMTEAEELGLGDHVDRILTTGTDSVGLAPGEAPAETLEAMRKASLIISKGMANFESLSDADFRPIAYLMRTKCESVSEAVGVPMNKSVAKLVL